MPEHVATELEELLEEIAADPEGAYRLQPRLHRIMASLSSHGLSIPFRLRNLDRQLSEDAAESRFDNMPI